MRVQVVNPPRSLTSKELPISKICRNIRDVVRHSFRRLSPRKRSRGPGPIAEKKEEIGKRGRVCKRREASAVGRACGQAEHKLAD